MVYEWVGGKHACVNLIGVSPLMGLEVRAFTVGLVAIKATSKMCYDNKHAFMPFIFYTFGFLALEVVDLLHRLQWVMHNNVMYPRFMNVVFTKIDFDIQKGLTAQLIVRFLSIHV